MEEIMRYIYKHTRDKSISSPAECSWKAVVKARLGRNLKIKLKEKTKAVKKPKFIYTFGTYDTTSLSAYNDFEINRLSMIMTGLIKDCTTKYYNNPKRVEYALQKAPYVLFTDKTFKSVYSHTMDVLVSRKAEKLLRHSKGSASANSKLENYKKSLQNLYDWKQTQLEIDLSEIKMNNMIHQYVDYKHASSTEESGYNSPAKNPQTIEKTNSRTL